MRAGGKPCPVGGKPTGPRPLSNPCTLDPSRPLLVASDVSAFRDKRRVTAAGACHRLTRPGSTDKQGSVWVRWILCEAAQKAKHSPQFAASYQSIANRRGTKIATTAIARKLLTRAYHLLTDAASGATPTSREGPPGPDELA